MLLTLIMTFFWKKMPWVQRYITQKECSNCALHIEVQALCIDMRIVKGVALDLAVASGLPVEKYKALATGGG